MAELQKEFEELKELIPTLLTKKELGAEIEKSTAEYQKTLKSYEDKINALQGKFDEIDKSFAEKISGLKINKANGLSDEDKVNFAKMLIGMKNKNDTQVAAAYKDIEQKDLASDVDADGGYTVPTPVSNEIYRIAKDSSLILANATNLPFTGTTMKLPTVATDVTVEWVGQNSAPTKADPKFGKVDLTKEKVMGYSVVASEMLTDPQVGIVDFLLRLFSEATGYAIDEQGFSGSGSPFTGIVNNGGVNATSGALSYDSLSDLIAALDKPSLTGASFYANKSVINDIRQLKDSNGNPIWANAVTGNGAQILGYGYDSTNVLANDKVVFGSLKNTVISADAITLALQYQAKTDNYDVVTKQRIAFAIPTPKSFAVQTIV